MWSRTAAAHSRPRTFWMIIRVSRAAAEANVSDGIGQELATSFCYGTSAELGAALKAALDSGFGWPDP
jgi:hypothetical protein